MSCGQGFKFLNQSFSDIEKLINETISIDITDNADDIERMMDRSNRTFWESVASDDDTIDVVMTTSFNDTVTISHLMLFGTNLKGFTFEYFDGAIFQTLITETTNSETDYVNIFSSVSTTEVRLTMSTTMVVDEEKKVSQFIITDLIGQLQLRPPATARHNANIVNQKLINGFSKILYNQTQHVFDLQFKSYTNLLDRQLLIDLTEFRDAFLFWPSGGDVTQFVFSDNGYRLSDIYLMAISNGPSHNYTKNFYNSGTNQEIKLIEVA